MGESTYYQIRQQESRGVSPQEDHRVHTVMNYGFARSIKRVIVVSNSCAVGGGASKVAIKTAEILSSQTECEVCFFCGLSTPEAEKLLESHGVHVLSMRNLPYQNRAGKLLPALSGLYDFAAARVLCNLIEEGDPSTTLVHFHSWLHALSPSPFFAAASCGVRVCVTAHDYFSICPNGGLFDYNRLEKCDRKTLGARCLLCNCDKRSYIQKLYRCLRYMIQTRGLKVSRASLFAISEISELLLREHDVPGGVRGMLRNPISAAEAATVPCNIDRDSFYLYVGRVDPEKGVALLCEAARLAKSKLVVIGDGSLMAQLRSEYPEVRFEGWKEFNEIVGYYKSARAIVIPSLWYEGSPLVVLEAKALDAGPFIVPTECGASEGIQDGVDGIVFESGRVDSLAAALRTLKDDAVLKRMRMGGNMPAGHSLEEYAKSLLGAYAAC